MPASSADPTVISPAAHRRGLIALLVSIFFSWGGFFLVIPLVSVHYVDQLGWTAASIGLALAIRQLTQQGLGAFFGALSDRTGPKPLIASGMLVRAAGFAGMAFAHSYPTLLASLILAGIGGSFFDSPKAAAIAALTAPAERQRFYALSGVVAGVGVTLGTQAGALLIRADFAAVCLTGAVCYVIIFLAISLFLPPVRSATHELGSGNGLRMALTDRTFMAFLLTQAGYWFAWVQFALTMTLAAISVAHTDSAVAWIYGVNSVITLALGYLLPRYLERWLTPLAMLAAGTILIALGLGAVSLTAGVAGILACAAIYSLGSVLATPAQQTVTAYLAKPAARGSYFGISSLSLAIGGGAGNFLGGVLYDAGQHHGLPALPWLTFCVVALASSAGLWLGRARFSEPAELVTATEIEPALASAATAVPQRT